MSTDQKLDRGLDLDASLALMSVGNANPHDSFLVRVLALHSHRSNEESMASGVQSPYSFGVLANDVVVAGVVIVVMCGYCAVCGGSPS